MKNLSFLIFHLSSQKGFTLIELILVMAIFSTLIGITSLSLFNIQHRTALSADVSVFTADLKQQQL
ncbi:MAG TPA: type II secretion system protein, partial [Candidatus Saccharimonadales bacterium]|nr:type II secretion system protein [Candidatus Saccharimonadales bacterium]